MPELNREESTHATRLDLALVEYARRIDSGEPIDREAFIAEYADMAEKLRACLATGDEVERLGAGAGSLARATSETQTLPPPADARLLVPETLNDVSRPSPSLSQGGKLRNFGDYELLEEIARGGMGVVYKARQVKLNRLVALKMILAGQLASAEDVKRFRTEAEAAANLQHPNIVAIHEVGEHEGQHYFSMDYVEGRSLADVVRENPLSAKKSAEYVRSIAEAIQYAHERGTLHRDLKPSNVLIDTNDRPRVTDFGLAKRIGGGSELTGTGQILGTPSYMPPEQAAGNRGAIGLASDVYALGAILYELLTGRPPFRAETPLDTLIQVLESDPAAPQLVNPKVPADLQTICLKCLEKDPRARYATAADLADDLRRYLAGETIAASSINIIGRVTRTLSRSIDDEGFHAWGQALVAFGLVILASHAAIYWLERSGQPWLVAHGLPRGCMVLAIGAIMRYGRPQSMLPTNTNERLIWSIWLGYLAAYIALSCLFAAQKRDHLELFAASSVLSGLCFFVMGSHVWGWNYVIGLTFMAAAPVMALDTPTSPLVFGILWAAALGTLGGRYLWLGRERKPNG